MPGRRQLLDDGAGEDHQIHRLALQDPVAHAADGAEVALDLHAGTCAERVP